MQGALAGGFAVAGSSVQGALSGATSAARLLQSRFGRRASGNTGEDGAVADGGNAALPPPDATALARISTELQAVASADCYDADGVKGADKEAGSTVGATGPSVVERTAPEQATSTQGPATAPRRSASEGAAHVRSGSGAGSGNDEAAEQHSSEVSLDAQAGAAAPGQALDKVEEPTDGGSGVSTDLLQLAADAEARFGIANSVVAGEVVAAAEVPQNGGSAFEEAAEAAGDAVDPLLSEAVPQCAGSGAASSHNQQASDNGGGSTSSERSHVSAGEGAIARTLERQSTGGHAAPPPGGLAVDISDARTMQAHGRVHAEYFVATCVAEGRHSGGWRRFSDVRALHKSLEATSKATGKHTGASCCQVTSRRTRVAHALMARHVECRRPAALVAGAHQGGVAARSVRIARRH